MHIKVNSTRHTKAGTFRRGVTYPVDAKDRLVRAHVLPLLEGDGAAFVKVADPAATAPVRKKAAAKKPEPVAAKKPEPDAAKKADPQGDDPDTSKGDDPDAAAGQDTTPAA